MEQHTSYSYRYRPGAMFVLVLATYFLLQIVIRLSLPGALELDEAEQAFVFQDLRFGYGTQPPLYAWLQWLAFAVFGFNLFALSALKNFLLFATYLGMFQLARPMIGVTGAMAASASLILFPSIGWEAQVDRTHSVLLTCLACATLRCYFGLLRRPVTTRYALLGLLAGLGLQSKYNFSIFLAGLATASLLTPEHRQILLNRRVWVTAAVALLCLLPHGMWLFNHLEAASGETLRKLRVDDEDAGYVRDVARGLGNMLVAALAFITPLWLVYGLICRPYWRRTAIAWQKPDARFFIRLYLAFFGWMVLLLLSGEVGTIQSRWMQPLLFSLPLAFFVVLPGLGHAAVFRRILYAAGTAAIIIVLGLSLRGHLAPVLGKNLRIHAPYPQLSVEIARRFPDVRTVISDDMQTAGNLYFQRPMVRAVALDDVLRGSEQVHGQVLLVLHASRRAGSLADLCAAYPGSVVQEQGRLDLRNAYGNGQRMTFDYALLTTSGMKKPAWNGRAGK